MLLMDAYKSWQWGENGLFEIGAIFWRSRKIHKKLWKRVIKTRQWKEKRLKVLFQTHIRSERTCVGRLSFAKPLIKS